MRSILTGTCCGDVSKSSTSVSSSLSSPSPRTPLSRALRSARVNGTKPSSDIVSSGTTWSAENSLDGRRPFSSCAILRPLQSWTSSLKDSSIRCIASAFATALFFYIRHINQSMSHTIRSSKLLPWCVLPLRGRPGWTARVQPSLGPARP